MLRLGAFLEINNVSFPTCVDPHSPQGPVTMASNSIPLPPRTPTPPPEDPDAISHNTTGLGIEGMTFNPNALSPNPTTRFDIAISSYSDRSGPSTPLTPMTNGAMTETVSEDGKNPFNFQPTTYTVPKSPVIKSVSRHLIHAMRLLTKNRVSDRGVATSTSTAAYLIRYSSNHLLDLPHFFQSPFQCLLSKNAERPCQKSKSSGRIGVSATLV